MSDEVRPLPYDASGEEVAAFIDANETGEWWMLDRGDYETCAGETMRKDGTGFQRVVLIGLPVRRNKTQERKHLYVVLDPEDAEGLARTLNSTAKWMRAVRRMEG